MNRWGRHADDLAEALTGLLDHTARGVGPADPGPGRDPGLPGPGRRPGPGACRVGRWGPGCPGGCAVDRVRHHPAPGPGAAPGARRSPCGRPSGGPGWAGLVDSAGLTDDEQLWRDAARACEGLQDVTGALGELRGEHGWLVLRDLADASAVLPALGWALSEAIRPLMRDGAPLALAYESLGTPIYAASTGTVIAAGAASGDGRWVKVTHPGDVTTVYGHVSRTTVTVGQPVQAGHIAYSGNEGRSTGPH